MKQLIADFPSLDAESAAAILGNLGHESGGFALLQEQHPVSGIGGYGWAQWTGERRTQYLNYCKEAGLDPASDKANYAWLFLDLRGPYSYAISAVVSATGLEQKVIAFESHYEYAGVKDYPKRLEYAQEALDAFNHQGQSVPQPQTTPTPVQPNKPTTQPKTETSMFSLLVTAFESFLPGYKTYIASAAGVVGILVGHFWPGLIPGLPSDPTWLEDLLPFVGLAGLRSGINTAVKK